MSNKYYYLVSSLPYLTFGRRLPITRERFKAECEKWLIPRDLTTLLNLDKESLELTHKDKGLMRDWKEFDTSLKSALAEARNIRRLSLEKRIPELAQDILGQETPLEMERHFEKNRWDFLDEKEIDYHFDLNWLIIYSLKLRIKERLTRFDKEKGFEIFDKVCEAKI